MNQVAMSKIQKISNYEVGGIPILFYSIMTMLIMIFWQAGKLENTGIVGAFAFMWGIGFFFYAIGEKLPIWNSYVGGGMIMAFLGAAALVHFEVVSANDASYLKGSVIDNKFLYLLLTSLVAASILSIPSKILIKSLFAYVPIIVAGLLTASIFGIAIGFSLGIDPSKIITHYVLPIMGGGNGAGAIPMAEIYGSSTGKDSSEYYSYAISILTLANVIAIFIASLLNKLGAKFPTLTGNGKLIKNYAENDNLIEEDEELDESVTLNTHAALLFSVCVLLLCFLLYSLIPAIHLFAWAVIVIIAVNVLDVLTPQQKKSIRAFSEWGMKMFLILVLVAVGLMTDLNELVGALTIDNIIICIFIVSGAVLGTAFTGRFFGFYPIETAICAGLCMANRGGSGDLEVLSASKRMELYPYAQISSRIGGGLVLLIAGSVFGLLV
jgi:Na+/citrate or Na+/malate symporter